MAESLSKCENDPCISRACSSFKGTTTGKQEKNTRTAHQKSQLEAVIFLFSKTDKLHAYPRLVVVSFSQHVQETRDIVKSVLEGNQQGRGAENLTSVALLCIQSKKSGKCKEPRFARLAGEVANNLLQPTIARAAWSSVVVLQRVVPLSSWLPASGRAMAAEQGR